MADVSVLDQIVQLTRRKRDLEAEIDELKSQLNETEILVLEYMADSGMQSVKKGEGATIYIHRQLWAHCKDVPAFKFHHPELIQETVNTHSLSAWVREKVRDEEWAMSDEGLPVLPDDIKDVIGVSEKIKAMVRFS